MTQTPDAPGDARAALAARLADLTPEQRALLLRQLAQRRAQAAAPEAIERSAQPGQRLPLSPAQQRMWFFERLQPGTGAYHVYGAHRLLGPLDADALARAHAEVVRRHDALRMAFGEAGGEPYQIIQAEVDAPLARHDVPGATRDARDDAAQRMVDAECERPFDLARAPLLRATLLRLAGEEHILVLVMHHIVSDAWSLGIVQDELATLYAAYVQGQPSPLPEPALQFGDCVLWQCAPAQRERAAAQLSYWQDALAGTSGLLDLPTDRPRPPASLGRGARHTLALPQDLVDALSALARAEGVTLFMALLAAFQALLSRHAGQADVVVGTPVANRGGERLAPVVGLFINTLALRADLSGDPGFRTLLAVARRSVPDALDHAEAALERVIDSLSIERAPGRTPLFQTMFVLQNVHSATVEWAGLRSEWVGMAANTTRFELTLSLEPNGSGLGGVIDYDIDLFDAATIARLGDQYAALLRGVLADPDRPLSRVAVLDPPARAELLALGDGGDAPEPGVRDLFELFARQAEATPDAVALVEPEREWRYAQVLGRANGLAAALHALGVAPEARVAVLADRSADAVIGVLGVLAAGAAYVPLDPAQPDARLHALLQDCGAQAVLAPAGEVARARALGAAAPVLDIAGIAPAPRTPDVGRSPAHAAYVIYTSGSTGRPKGVVVEHRGALNLVLGFLQRHDFAGARLLMVPPLVFDASVGDVFPVLGSGGALVLHPRPGELGAAELRRFCDAHRIDAIDAPAALWRRWVEAWSQPGGTAPPPGLRTMMIGGEGVPLARVRDFAAVTARQTALYNHYGPTEASVCATMLRTVDGAEFDGAQELPIGAPLPGVRAYVLDTHGALAPRGAVGELCIGGAGVARAYLGQPGLTADAFPGDPFAAAYDGAAQDAAAQGMPRMYRTGDLARWRNDGQLQFLGRRDQQIKLRGFRIEPAEIEHALVAHPQVEAAAVLLREDRPGDKRLVAYVVGAQAPTVGALREHLARHLPEALVPSAYVRLPALPLTRNGKVDRAALPRPDTQPALERAVIAPATPTEHAVLAVWRELLGRDDLSADDDFFAAGGDSLMTLPLVSRLHAALGVDLPLADVFAAPTIAALARRIDALNAGEATHALDLDALAVLPPEIDPAGLPGAGDRGAPTDALVTGATGFLGAYLVRELLDLTDARIHCLVRADGAEDGLARIAANLQAYGLWREADRARLLPLPGDLAQPLLGLSEDAFDALARRVDVVFHNGGQVNFLAPYAHLEAANVGGTREVLRLATRHTAKPVHLVSTLGIYVVESRLAGIVRESDPPPPGAEQSGGYNQSKWVGEQLALIARARGLPVAVYRPARITGDSRTGASNPGDYFNAWIRGCLQLGAAPHLPDEAFDMAPVDYVGSAIVRIALGAGAGDGDFHFYNGRRLPIPEAVRAMREAGMALEEIAYPAWRARLLESTAHSRENALAPFAGLFPEHPDPREPRFDCSAAEGAVASSGLTCPPADRALMARYLAFLAGRGVLPAAAVAPERGA